MLGTLLGTADIRVNKTSKASPFTKLPVLGVLEGAAGKKQIVGI